MSVDTFMLARYSEKAVAAMSLVNQFAFFIQLIYMMVSIGASIMISQNLGAGKRATAGLVGVGGLVLIAGLSIILSTLVALFATPLIALYKLDPEVALYARQFLTIYGGFSFFMAFNIGQSSIVRSWGHSYDPMWVNVISLVLTVCGNALCLFGFFGFPILGVAGVAGSTVFSQVVVCGIYYFLIKRRKDIELPLHKMAHIPRSVYKAVMNVGIPTVGENLSYNLSQIAIMTMITQMGTDTMTTFGILITVLRYVFMPGVSIGSGTQIKVGYLVGAGMHDEATRRVYKYFTVGFLISLVFIVLVVIMHQSILGIFSPKPNIFVLATSVLLVAVIHEPGRNFNTIFIPALKGAGDVHFPVYVGIATMWGISVLGAWLLGVKLGLGIVGVWIAMTLDEWLRGIIMLLRWRSGAWKSKCLVQLTDAITVSSLVLFVITCNISLYALSGPTTNG
ncbi:MAG: MATE family efflux transporter [Oligoflexia bacterium]|nr:MATE family efflux transporter [Oligoflexia bacterium]